MQEITQKIINQNIKGPHISKVLENLKLSEDTYKLIFENKIIAANAKPGQFISILCEDLILRRPFSIANTKKETVEIIYKVKGKGTRFLKKLKPNDEINLIGPFGNGFTIENKKSLIIGCGVGIAPIIFLSNILYNEQVKHSSIACSQTNLNINNEFKDELFVITEDDTSELSGRLDVHLEKIINKIKPQKIYTCGPNPAMKFINEIAIKNNIDIEVAMEREFACGTGVCMGCVIKIKENDQILNKRICKDGPVFKGENVIW